MCISICREPLNQDRTPLTSWLFQESPHVKCRACQSIDFRIVLLIWFRTWCDPDLKLFVVGPGVSPFISWLSIPLFHCSWLGTVTDITVQGGSCDLLHVAIP